MTKKNKSLKQRKTYKRYTKAGTIKSSGKPNHATGWLNHIIGINDPLNDIVMPHEVDKWIDIPHYVIPFTYDKNNKDKLFVNFTKSDGLYIEYWLNRMENEICHKHLQHPHHMFNHMLQPVNHYSTHDAVGQQNSTLTMISGLRINFLRNGEEPQYLYKQLAMIEHCFWMSWWLLRGYYEQLNAKDKIILTDQDVGFRKANNVANPPLYPIHFVEYKKSLNDETLFSDVESITL